MKVYSGNLLPKLSSLIDCFVYTYIFCPPSAAVFPTTGNIYRAQEGKITQPQISSQCEWSYGKLSILQWKAAHTSTTITKRVNIVFGHYFRFSYYPITLLLASGSELPLPTKAISWAQHPHLLEASRSFLQRQHGSTVYSDNLFYFLHNSYHLLFSIALLH